MVFECFLKYKCSLSHLFFSGIGTIFIVTINFSIWCIKGLRVQKWCNNSTENRTSPVYLSIRISAYQFNYRLRQSNFLFFHWISHVLIDLFDLIFYIFFMQNIYDIFCFCFRVIFQMEFFSCKICEISNKPKLKFNKNSSYPMIIPDLCNDCRAKGARGIHAGASIFDRCQVSNGYSQSNCQWTNKSWIFERMKLNIASRN